MKVALIITIVIAVALVAFIFFLCWVLKNTFKTFICSSFDSIVSELPIDLETAYDGKYYPCTLLLQIDKTTDGTHTQIYDFSLYDSRKLVGLQIITDEFDEDEYGTHIIPHAIVYQPFEGDWLWKLDQEKWGKFNGFEGY